MAKLIRGMNDLATTHPELAAQWHPDNNGLTPADISAGSNKVAKWLLPYDDPQTGKHFDFVWEAEIKSRAKGATCPYLSGKAVWKGFNDLATTHPELAAEWHPDKNGDLTPEMISAGSGKKVWWAITYDDPDTGKSHYYEWPAKIENRARGSQCPFIMSSKGEKSVRDILEAQGISFAEQHVFQDRVGLSGKNLLRDDFAIFNTSGAIVGTIEFHGRQHYETIHFGGKSQIDAEEKFRRTQVLDKMKTDYLKQHGISQLVIPYNEENKIQELVNGFIQELSKEHEIIERPDIKEEIKDVPAWTPTPKYTQKQVKDFRKQLQNNSRPKNESKKNHRNTNIDMNF